MTSQDNRRFIRLIEPYRQLKFGIFFLILNFVFAMLILGVFGYYMWDMYSSIRVYFALNEAESLMTLQKFFVPATIALVLIIVFIGLTLYLSVYFTHRIYGPIVSIKRFLDDLALQKGGPDQFKIREKDELHGLVEGLNFLAGKLNQVGYSEVHMQAMLEFVDKMIDNKKVTPLEFESNSTAVNLLKLKLNNLADHLNTRK